jgi:hypothetical protein
MISRFKMDLRFRHPFTAIIAGPTACGKTVFTKTFIDNLSAMCDTVFAKIIWYYDEMQPIYDGENVEYIHGLPDMNSFSGVHPILIILDDLMGETGKSVIDIFTKGSHHRNLSVFYISQNLFHQGKGQRDISLNANYLIYFKNPRDKMQINHLARQISPENSKFVQEAYANATGRPHGYLLFDLKQDTPDEYRLRTNILPNERPSYAYIPKKGYKYKFN